MNYDKAFTALAAAMDAPKYVQQGYRYQGDYADVFRVAGRLRDNVAARRYGVQYGSVAALATLYQLSRWYNRLPPAQQAAVDRLIRG